MSPRSKPTRPSLRARIYAEVFQILTSDQQAKLKTMQAEMQQRRRCTSATAAAAETS